jgi:hypothetical protein
MAAGSSPSPPCRTRCGVQQRRPDNDTWRGQETSRSLPPVDQGRTSSTVLPRGQRWACSAAGAHRSTCLSNYHAGASSVGRSKRTFTSERYTRPRLRRAPRQSWSSRPHLDLRSSQSASIPRAYVGAVLDGSLSPWSGAASKAAATHRASSTNAAARSGTSPSSRRPNVSQQPGG